MIALAVILFSNAQAQVPSYVPTNGLVGWWPFNGNANDESGNGNNGVVNGPTLTNDRFGVANKAYNFDGVNDYVEVVHSSTLTFATSVTFSFWVNIPDNSFNTTGNPERNPIGKQRSSGLGGSGIAWETNDQIGVPGTPQFYLNSGNSVVQYEDVTPLVLNNWNHLVGVYDGSILSLYSNGALLGSSLGNLSLSNIVQNLFFGKEGSNGRFYKGSIDDIGIWNRALTQQEITNLYNSSAYVPCASPAFPANLANGLVGYWPFCGDANDESGNGNNGTVNGATLTSDRFGNPNSAYDFDGVNDYINIGNPIGTQTTDFSVSFWAKRNLNGGGIAIAKKPNDGVWANGRWMIDLYNTNLNYCLPNPNLQGCTSFNNNINNDLNWHNVVLSHNFITDCIYLDGILINNSPSGLVSQIAADIRIGGREDALNFPYFGQLDDFGIWNRALTASEVQQLYNTGIYFQTVTGSCDTLQFNANITGFNPVTYQNQVKVFPNPAKDNLVIDCGANYNTLNGYSIRIVNTLSQTVYNSPITQQITNIQLIAPTWSNGAYVVQFINPSGTVIEAKQIIIQ